MTDVFERLQRADPLGGHLPPRSALPTPQAIPTGALRPGAWRRIPVAATFVATIAAALISAIGGSPVDDAQRAYAAVTSGGSILFVVYETDAYQDGVLHGRVRTERWSAQGDIRARFEPLSPLHGPISESTLRNGIIRQYVSGRDGVMTTKLPQGLTAFGGDPIAAFSERFIAHKIRSAGRTTYRGRPALMLVARERHDTFVYYVTPGSYAPLGTREVSRRGPTIRIETRFIRVQHLPTTLTNRRLLDLHAPPRSSSHPTRGAGIHP